MKELFEKYINGNNISLIDYLRYKRIHFQIDKNSNTDVEKGVDVLFSIEKVKRKYINCYQLSCIKSILIHGSQADNSVVGFSDIDIIVLINDTDKLNCKLLKRDLKQLRKICKEIFKRDPLMHHGLMFICQSEFRQYNEFFIPLDTLRNSKCAYGENMIQVTLIEKSPNICVDRLINTLKYLLNNYNEILNENISDYKLKNFISIVLLIPSLFLAAKQIFVDKKHSFNLCFENYKDVEWDIVRNAEVLRLAWEAPKVCLLHKLSIQLLGAKGQKISKFIYKNNTKKLEFRKMLSYEALEALNNTILKEYI